MDDTVATIALVDRTSGDPAGDIKRDQSADGPNNTRADAEVGERIVIVGGIDGFEAQAQAEERKENVDTQAGEAPGENSPNRDPA